MSNPEPSCQFCLDNHILKDIIEAEIKTAYVVKPTTSSSNYLLIPKDHIESLGSMSDNWWADVKQLLAQLPGFDDYNVSVNVGEQAGQKVKHIHFWLIPRVAGQPSSGKGFAKLIDEANQR